MRNPWVASVLGACIVACSSATAPSPTAMGLGFHRDIEPILQEKCQSCHVQGGLAPFPLVTYQDASSRAALIAHVTGQRIMPPWDAIETSECKPPLPWRADERLTDAEIATIASWASAGAPEGDPTSAVRAPDKKRALERVDVELGPSAPFVASGDRDQFRCFVLDPKLPLGAYIKGINVVPGNRKVVHHALVLADPKRAAESKAPIGQSYECGGGAMFTADQYILDVWTPGIDPIELPDDISMAIGANALVIMQIHYSPGGASADPDTTTVELELGLTKPPYLLFTAAIGNFASMKPNGDGLLPGPSDGAAPEFMIPARAKGHTETMRGAVPGTVPAGARIYGVMGHAHLAGTDVKIDLQKQSGASSCLLQDRWNFHWQRMYAYDAPIDRLPALEVGDKIQVRCTYDNNSDHALVLGEQTSNEMCLAVPQVLIPHP